MDSYQQYSDYFMTWGSNSIECSVLFWTENDDVENDEPHVFHASEYRVSYLVNVKKENQIFLMINCMLIQYSIAPGSFLSFEEK